MAKRALLTFGTETGEVLWARLFRGMPVPAALAVLTETTLIPRALICLILRPNVEKDAFLVPTLAKLGEIPAFWHPVVVETVQEVAAVALFA